MTVPLRGVESADPLKLCSLPAVPSRNRTVIGHREIVQHTQLTVEGTVRVAESSLTAEEDKVFKTEFSPFVGDDPLMRPTAATQLRVTLRKHHHGQVVLDLVR